MGNVSQINFTINVIIIREIPFILKSNVKKQTNTFKKHLQQVSIGIHEYADKIFHTHM